MNTVINDLRLSLTDAKIESPLLATESDIRRFSDVHNVQFPDDLVEYFRTVNGTATRYDSNFFQFYSLENFRPLEKTYLDWEGVPDFKRGIKQLPNYQNYFVIADYSIHVISYSIKLQSAQSTENDIYAVCGSANKRVAGSFTEFITMYMTDCSSLLI